WGRATLVLEVAGEGGHRVRDWCVSGEDCGGFAGDVLRDVSLGDSAHHRGAVVSPESVQSGDQPDRQVSRRVSAVVALVPVEEFGLGRGEVEPGRKGEAVIGEVEALSVGQDVREVGVEM